MLADWGNCVGRQPGKQSINHTMCLYRREYTYIIYLWYVLYSINSRNTSTYFILHTCLWLESKSVSRNKVNEPSVHIEKKTDIYNIIFR